ncbi:Fic family protein [Endozoicomonas lisbonensis]|uniref:Fic family protein n=1 Tax=Endozoicomonas lisbonensis TaxID=3120522 RepID=A0ABV2SNF7_9GAMM
MAKYQPPFTITPTILDCVAIISELLGRYSAGQYSSSTPILRRGNRIRTIQASLAIEHNTLSVEQVTAILEGKRVLGQPKEVLEVQNAFAAYDLLPALDPACPNDLLQVYTSLMRGLTDQVGCWRNSGVGIYRDEQLIHMPPPPSQVSRLMSELLVWVADTDLHPLIASCIFHYEFEFIHPFTDGNGRMGRFWQTLMLSKWREPMAFLPVETIIRDQQEAYYQALRESDKTSDSTPFIKFTLKAIEQALHEALESEPKQYSDQVNRQVSDQVKSLLTHFLAAPEVALKVPDMMQNLGLKHRPTFRKNYLKPALDLGLIIMTNPESPNSPKQSYLISQEGLSLVSQ